MVTNIVCSQTKECARKTNFGEIEICLPKIEGYKECYLDPTIKQIADATEVPVNMVLGYYLNDKAFKNKDSIVSSGFDDFFKLYGTKQIKDYKANESILKETQKALAGNFLSKNWDVIKDEIDKTGIDAKIGVPVVVKSYNLNKKSFTYVMIANYEVKGTDPYTMAMAMNGVLLNDRLVWLAYYILYKDKSTIDILQEKSNKIILRI